MTTEIIRTVRVSGFTLRLYDQANQQLGYRLFRNGAVLFEGNDFRPSPMHAVDSDESIVALFGFLTLQPGDTDREYFDNYTPAQLDFARHDAERLAVAVMNRWPSLF